MFGNKQEKKFIDMLQKKNEKIEAENKKLLTQIRNYEEQREEITNTRNHFNTLIGDLERLKKEYQKKLQEIETLEAEYKKALDDLIKSEVKKR